MKNILFLVLLIISLSFVASAWGKEKKRKNSRKKAKKTKIVTKVKPVPGMFTVTGVVSKTVIDDKEIYILTSRSGDIVALPTPKAPKKESVEDAPEAINITEYLNQRVSIFGKGFSRVVKNSLNPKVSIKEIINIRIVSKENEEKDPKDPEQ